MSGYFARLLSRAQQAAPAVRPQTALRFSAPPFVDGSLEPQLVEEAGAPARERQAIGEHHARRERSVPSLVSQRDARVDERIPSRPSVAPPLLAHEEYHARSATVHSDTPSRERSAEPDDHAGERTARLHPATDDAPRHAPSASSSADAPRVPRAPAEFQLMPTPPAAAADRVASTGMDSAAFARAVEDARAQIQRQLAAHGGTPSEVHVTIGRIEVTATPSAPSAPRKAPDRTPAVTLEQYLASRVRRGS